MMMMKKIKFRKFTELDKTSDSVLIHKINIKKTLFGSGLKQFQFDVLKNDTTESVFYFNIKNHNHADIGFVISIPKEMVKNDIESFYNIIHELLKFTWFTNDAKINVIHGIEPLKKYFDDNHAIPYSSHHRVGNISIPIVKNRLTLITTIIIHNDYFDDEPINQVVILEYRKLFIITSILNELGMSYFKVENK